MRLEQPVFPPPADRSARNRSLSNVPVGAVDQRVCPGEAAEPPEMPKWWSISLVGDAPCTSLPDVATEGCLPVHGSIDVDLVASAAVCCVIWSEFQLRENLLNSMRSWRVERAPEFAHHLAPSSSLSQPTPRCGPGCR